jgi:UDP-N-acetylmuramyl tripeptide synthase
MIIMGQVFKVHISFIERIKLMAASAFNSIRYKLAFFAGRLAALGCHLIHRPATSLPGVVALKIYPDLVGYLTPAYDQVLAVTGTNGKTTTANLLAHFLQAGGQTVAHNSEGANMLPGIATALLKDCNAWGSPRSRIALLEVDEGSVGKVFPKARPDLLVVTNYFRDQLDRYWELERTISLLKSTLDDLPGMQLVLNADDPLVAAIGTGRSDLLFYGVSRSQHGNPVAEQSVRHDPFSCAATSPEETREGRFCSLCGAELTYRYYHYGQLGDYYCSQCGFSRPVPDYSADGVIEADHLSFKVRSGGGEIILQAPMRGFYNVYNILAAVAAASTLGMPMEQLKVALLDYKPVTGRMEEFELAGKPCTLALIKNPAGVNEVLKTILTSERDKSVAIAINDLAADGRDVSWLWDADFARLDDPHIRQIICAGRRAADFAICLKYSGIDTRKLLLAPELPESLSLLKQQEGDELYVLATYTNLYQYAALLSKMGKEISHHATESLPSLS